ncbi:MAG: beta-galactosidase [Planctomycetota bacterium]
MPSISYDRKSFLIDGRRVWLVSGAIHYPRTPRGLWRDRLRAAREAGLNCIETYVFWNAHEREPGRFDFTGDLDLRAFVKMVGEEGMYCILRPGPYVCAEWDFGGLPPYLHQAPSESKSPGPIRLRQSDPDYLEAVSRYLKAVMEQVGDLQITTSHDGPRPKAPRGNPVGGVAGGYRGDAGGPIVLMQVENEWFSHNPEQQEAYLERLVSMMRQNGCAVPISNCNNLWQPVEGTIDTWNGCRDLPAVMRQLSTVQPETPPMVSEYWTGWYDCWGAEHASGVDAETHLYRMAGLLGVGAQFNLYMFHGGTNFGFFGARTSGGKNRYLTTSYDYDAPLGEAGERGPKYQMTKRLCMFASHFGGIIAQRSKDQPACVALSEEEHPLAVMQQSGSLGTAVVLLKSKKDRSASTELLLPNGLRLPVPLAGQRAAWLLLEANLGDVTLDYSNLSPWAVIARRLLVLFGPAGSDGIFSIDGQQQTITVPTGRQPLVIEGDAVHVLVLNTSQVDAAYLGPAGVVIGCDGLDTQGNPIALNGWSTQYTVALDGTVTSKRVRTAKTEPAPALAAWQTLSLKPMVDGDSSAYQAINGPREMERLDQPLGYGWYKLSLSKSISGRVCAPLGGDRLHLYQSGKLAQVLGKGEGATDEPTQMKLGGDVVVLADHLGRYNYGQAVGEDLKGLAGHLYTVKPFKSAKPKRVKQQAGDPFAISGMIYHRRAGDRPMAEALVWEVKPELRKPMVLEIEGLPQEAVLTVNGEPIAYYAADLSGGHLRVLLDPTDDGPMTGGKNAIALELLEPMKETANPTKQVRLYQTQQRVTPAGDGWSFAKWSVPKSDEDGWRPLPKSLPSQPAWFRSRFGVADTAAPLWLEPIGMTKGQIVLNGHLVGRYWQQTREGRKIGPQQRYYLPEPWLKTEADNELLIFDEHGRLPTSARLVHAVNAY